MHTPAITISLLMFHIQMYHPYIHTYIHTYIHVHIYIHFRIVINSFVNYVNTRYAMESDGVGGADKEKEKKKAKLGKVP